MLQIAVYKFCEKKKYISAKAVNKMFESYPYDIQFKEIYIYIPIPFAYFVIFERGV